VTRLPKVASDDVRDRLTSKYASEILSAPELPGLYAVLGNSPEMLSAWLDFAWTLRRSPQSSRALREMLILMVGAHQSAPYCVGAHRHMAVAEGVTQEKLDSLTSWRSADCFDALERACLNLTEAMLEQRVQDSDLRDVIELAGESQTVEIVLTVAFYLMVASVTTTFDLEPELPKLISGIQDA
jgi:AhpD family alkylhydroperoxidase